MWGFIELRLAFPITAFYTNKPPMRSYYSNETVFQCARARLLTECHGFRYCLFDFVLKIGDRNSTTCQDAHTHITFIQSNIFNENFNIMIDSHWTLNAIEQYWINKLTLFIDSIFNKLKFPQAFHIEWSTFTTTTCTSSYFRTYFHFSIRKKMNRHFSREHLPFDSNKNEKSFSNYSCKRFITLE